MFGSGEALYYEFGVRYARAFLFFTFINGATIIVTTFFPAIGKAKLGAILSLTRQFICTASSDASSFNTIWSGWTNFLRSSIRLHFIHDLHHSLYESNAQDSKGGRTSGIMIGSNGRGMIYGMV